MSSLADIQLTPARSQALVQLWTEDANVLRITGIAFLIFGSLLVATSVTLAILATPLTLTISVVAIALAVLLFWMGYNNFILSSNMNEMLQNKEAYTCEEQIKSTAGKNTLFLDGVIHRDVEIMKARLSRRAGQIVS